MQVSFPKAKLWVKLPHLHVENSSPLYLYSEGILWSDDPTLNRWSLMCWVSSAKAWEFFFRFRCCLCSCNRCFLKQIAEREKCKLPSSLECRTKAADYPFEMGTFLEHWVNICWVTSLFSPNISDDSSVVKMMAQKRFSLNRLFFLNSLTLFLKRSLLSTRFTCYFAMFKLLCQYFN